MVATLQNHSGIHISTAGVNVAQIVQAVQQSAVRRPHRLRFQVRGMRLEHISLVLITLPPIPPPLLPRFTDIRTKPLTVRPCLDRGGGRIKSPH